MSGTLDLHIDRGTTYRFDFQYGTDDSGSFTAYDLAGVEGRIEIGSLIVEDAVTIDESTNTVHITLSNDVTKNLAKDTPYGVYLTFPSGDVKQPLRGTVFVR
jgi:hypothetical protein